GRRACRHRGTGRRRPSNRGGSTRSALPDGLVDDDGCRGGDVERVRPSHHGDPYAVGRAGEGRVSQSVLLRAHGHGDGTGEVGIGVLDVGVRGRRDDVHPALREPGEGLIGGRGGHGDGEDRALARADDVGVAPVGHQVGGDHERDPRGVRGPEDRAEAARLLHALAQQDERVVGEHDVGEGAPRRRHPGEDAVRALAVRDLLEGGPAELDDLGAHVARPLHERGTDDGVEHELRAVEEDVRNDPGIEGEAGLLQPLEERRGAALADAPPTEGDEVLQTLVGRRGDDEIGHGGSSMPHNRLMADDRPVSALRLLLAAAAMTVAMLLVAALGEWALVPSAGVRELDEGGVARAVGLLADVTWLESAGRLWSDLTRPWVVHTVVLVVALALLAGRRVPPRALLVVPAGLLGRALGVVCKELVERPRPAEGVIDYTSWSYPSGHATNVALGAVLLLALLRAVRTGWIRWSAT